MAAVIAVFAVIALVHRLSGSGGSADLVGTERSYVYCDNGGIAERLDVYGPIAQRGDAPTLVDLHGGGWVSGDADLQPQTLDWDVERALVARGWVFVSIDYRLAPTSRWPAQIEDAKCAIRFLRANAPELHVDRTRIGVIGASAGGQLAAMVGLTGNGSLFDTGWYGHESSSVEAVVDEYGPTDLTSPDLLKAKGLRYLSKETFGVEAGQQSPVLEDASPVTYVQPGAPPFLVIQGAEDEVVLPSQSTELVDRLDRVGDVSKLIMVQHAGHGLVRAGDQPVTPDLARLTTATVDFLTRQLSARS